MRSCVRVFVRSCVRVVVRSCVRAVVRSCVRAFVCLCELFSTVGILNGGVCFYAIMLLYI